MSTNLHEDDVATDTGVSPTTDSSDSQPSIDQDPYEACSDAHGLIRDDGSPLVEEQLYPSTIAEHMQLIEQRAANSNSDHQD